MLLSFIVVILVLVISGKGINIAVWPYLIVVILQETLLGFGLAMIFSAITVYFRDMQYFLGIITMAWQFLSPVMYSVEMVPEELVNIFYLNPMTPIIVAYRDIFYYQKAPDLQDFLLGTIFGIVVLVVGWLVFGKMKKHFAEVL